MVGKARSRKRHGAQDQQEGKPWLRKRPVPQLLGAERWLASLSSTQKVDEVRKWLSKWLPSAKRPTSGALLVLRGPPGCGKRELVRLLAAEIGFSVCEYVAPLASSWGEFEYAMRDPESRYVRPIDHFQDFLMHAIHLPMLSLGERGGSGHGKVRAR